jgi:hypothetical protein
MLKLVRSTMLALAFTATAAGAFPTYASRYVDDKSGYVVETRDVGGWLRVAGRHPETGKTFKVKVSPAGRVVGTWDGKAIDYVMGAKAAKVELAQTASASAGGR